MGRQRLSECSGKTGSNWTIGEDDLVFVGRMSTKSIHLAVLDAAFMYNKEDNLINFAESFVSIPEITCLLSFLPCPIHTLEPSPDSVKRVTTFASQTGDLRRLSDVDLKLIALTYTLESLVYGTEHLDKESWMLRSMSESNIACITANSAAQNLILKMGLRLVAPRPLIQIYKMRRFVLSCNVCSMFTAEIGRTSCGKCGNRVILHKAAVTVIRGFKAREKENIQTLNQWSNMPPDLLDLIISKLYYIDRIQFQKVCKDWCRPIGTRIDNELPWIMCFNYSNPHLHHTDFCGISEIVLLDPLYKRIYKTLDSTSRHSKILSNSCLCGTKNGWLILKEMSTADCIKIFLYNPFSGELFKLPMLFSSFFPIYYTAFFSSNPTMPDCIFVVLHTGPTAPSKEFRVLGISTFRNGDKDWKTKKFDKFDKGGYYCNGMQCLCTSKGICYILLGDGGLVSFNLENQEWIWLVKSPFREWQFICKNLVEFDGGLLAVIHSYDDLTGCAVYRYKFDEKERGWIEEKSLGNKALFLNPYECFVRSTFGETSDLAGAILRIIRYIHSLVQVTTYILKDNKFYNKVGAYDCWINIHGFDGKIWVEPPYTL